MAEAKIGVIGGSGLYAMEGLEDVENVSLETPFGAPSDDYVVGKLAGKSVAFLARHGVGPEYRFGYMGNPGDAGGQVFHAGGWPSHLRRRSLR